VFFFHISMSLRCRVLFLDLLCHSTVASSVAPPSSTPFSNRNLLFFFVTLFPSSISSLFFFLWLHFTPPSFQRCCPNFPSLSPSPFTSCLLSFTFFSLLLLRHVWLLLVPTCYLFFNTDPPACLHPVYARFIAPSYFCHLTLPFFSI